MLEIADYVIIEEQEKKQIDDEKKWCVYCHTSPSGKKYIGITGENNPDRRWGSNGNGYLRRKPNGDFQQPAIARAILKYPDWSSWTHEILLSGLTADESCKKEDEFIEKYNTRNPMYGYNIKPGGNVASGENHPMYGKHHSEETKRKISQTRIEKGLGRGELNPNYNKTQKEWMSEDAYKRWKQEISEASKQNWKDENFRKKRHESQKKYWDEHPERKEQLRVAESGENSQFYGKTPQEMMGFDEEKIKKWKTNIGNSVRGENNFWYGKHLYEETKQKISNTRIERKVAKGKNNPMYGKYHTEETKGKISEALTGKYSGINNKNNKMVFCIDLNKIFYSAICAQNETGVYSKNIGACCRHYRDFKVAGGYKWCFCDDYTTNNGVFIPGAITLGYITEEEVNNYLDSLRQKGNDINGTMEEE